MANEQIYTVTYYKYIDAQSNVWCIENKWVDEHRKTDTITIDQIGRERQTDTKRQNY